MSDIVATRWVTERVFEEHEGNFMDCGDNIVSTVVRVPKLMKVGCVVLIKNPKGYGVGWSICNEEDKFSSEKAKQIAEDRAVATTSYKVMPDFSNVPFRYRKQVVRLAYELIADYISNNCYDVKADLRITTI